MLLHVVAYCVYIMCDMPSRNQALQWKQILPEMEHEDVVEGRLEAFCWPATAMQAVPHRTRGQKAPCLESSSCHHAHSCNTCQASLISLTALSLNYKSNLYNSTITVTCSANHAHTGQFDSASQM